MNIKVAHLYYDLMNLYGESGNVKALKMQLEGQGIKTTIKFLTIDDDLNFKDYDIVYIGSGTENNQKIVLNHLLKYKKDIENAIEKGVHFICTGNALELFGNVIEDVNNKKYTALGMFEFDVKQEEVRMVDEVLFKTDLINKYILGFQNQSGHIKSDILNLFDVVKGIGSYIGSKKEGIHYKNFYGTYVIGPILVRNPELLKYLVKEIINKNNKNFKFKKYNQKLEIEAYDNFMSRNYQEYISNK